MHNLNSLLKSNFNVSKQKKIFFGVEHSTAIHHLKSRLLFDTIPLQQDTSFMEMEGSYGLSQRAEITWQHQRKGQKKKIRKKHRYRY